MHNRFHTIFDVIYGILPIITFVANTYGFLMQMAHHKINPNSYVCSYSLKILPVSIAAEFYLRDLTHSEMLSLSISGP